MRQVSYKVLGVLEKYQRNTEIKSVKDDYCGV